MIRRCSKVVNVLALAALLAVPVVAKEITVHGKLQKTVEAGGWLIVTADQKYLILNAERFQREKWFTEGAEVEATGEAKPDVITTQMEGIPFEARTVRPSTSSRSSAADAKLLTRITVAGDALVQAQPDTANITISVVTQNKRALDAQQ